MKEAAQRAVAKDTSFDLFLADQMLKKASDTSAKALADSARDAYDAAMGERNAFDEDIDALAMAAFKLMHTRANFVKDTIEKYPN